MTRLLWVVLAGTAAVGVWLPLWRTLDPTTLTPSVPFAALGVVGTAAVAWWLGAWTARHTGEGLEGAALAGAAVGSTAWAFGLAPTLAALSQAPVLLPVAFAPDARTLLTSALPVAVRQGVIWQITTPLLFILAGGALGAFGGREVARGLAVAAPGPLGGWAAVWAVGLGLILHVVFRLAVPVLADSTADAASDGFLLVANPLGGWVNPVGDLVLSVGPAAGLFVMVLGLRRWTRLSARPGWLVWLGPLYAGLLVAAFLAVGHHDVALSFLIVLFTTTGATLIAAGLPMEVSDEPDTYSLPRALQLTAVLASLWGLGALHALLALALGAVGRIVPLTARGAAAPAQPELVNEIAEQVCVNSVRMFVAVWGNLTTPTVIWIVGLWVAGVVRRRRAG
jgi:hypothetical protein